MYRKLCKYEFKSIARTLLPIYLAVIVVSIINGISFGLDNHFSAPESFSPQAGSAILELMRLSVLFAYFGVMVALFVLTMIVIIQRFYKGLLCDEGYLMFTLPVKPWQLIASKGTAALVMSIVSGITGFLSIMILMCGGVGPIEFFSTLLDPRNWSILIQQLNEVFPKWGLYTLLYCFEGLIFTIVSGMAALFQIYVSMSLGHLARKHRIVMSVAAYIAISMALSFLSGAAVIFLDAIGIESLLNPATPHGAMQILFFGGLLWEGIKLAAFFFGTERILSKKLNLE
ncbi:MAG: hypothetical protein KH319_06335 [Butyricicoccus pullicaecorum]|jgi:hypothetical protein|nr:hypothetical protein [Butyricicoccus pullicaecorum]